jgi:CubicO group peptidase (beta-lactamase class C family)
VRASDLTTVEFSSELFPKSHAILCEGVKEGVAPGFVAGFWTHAQPDRAFMGAVGSRRLIPSEQPLTIDTLFDISSVSKIYATATLAAILIDRGWLGFDAQVGQYFPGYPYPDIRVHHLLSHTAGFAACAPFWEKLRDHFAPTPLEEIPVVERQCLVREWVIHFAPEVKVGVRALYSDISFILLGYILEEITRMPLDQAVKHFVWEPLGAERSSYRHVTRDSEHHLERQTEHQKGENIAATENSQWRGGVLQGQVHDDNCWAMGGYAGHAGVFCDARDLLHFARRMLAGFISAPTIARLWSPISEPAYSERTLGWDMPSKTGSRLGDLMSRKSVGHWGYTGTSLWIDPDARFAVTLLSNRVHPTRENDRHLRLRPKFHDALILDLKKASWI